MTSPAFKQQRAAADVLRLEHMRRHEPTLYRVAGHLADVADRVNRGREQAQGEDARREADTIDARLRSLHRRARLSLVSIADAERELASIDAEARALRGGAPR